MHIYLKFRAKFTSDRESVRNELFQFWSSLLEVAPYYTAEPELNEDTLEVLPWFTDESLRVEFAEDHAEFTLRTSNAGPGYHAHSVGIFKKMLSQTPLELQEDTLQDETGYWFNGDFAALQAYMAKWLKRLSLLLLQEHERTGRINMLLNIPHYLLPDSHGYFACHSLGYLDKNFFADIISLDDFEPHCRAYFIWWDEPMNAEFHLKAALYLIWCRINWLPPLSLAETMDYDNALCCLDTAVKENPAVVYMLPSAEWMELARLVGDDKLVRELQQHYPVAMSQHALRGYKRYRMMLCNMSDGWKIKIPGMLHMGYDDDGVLTFWDDTRRVHVTSVRVKQKDGLPVPALKLLEAAIGDETASRVILPAEANIKAYMLDAVVEGKPAPAMHETTLFAAVDGYIITVSIFAPEGTPRSWAADICNSLSPPWVESYWVLE